MLMNFRIKELSNSIKSYNSALVALSGGVDSSVVAALAKMALDDRAVAVTVDNGLLGLRDVERATQIAAQIGIRHVVLSADPLAVPEVKRNDPKRCYFCKKLMFGALRSLADEFALNMVMDGTTASDLAQYRPGIHALQELDVMSPLKRLNKEEVRGIARELGLGVADSPSMACLLTRFPYHTDITPQMLQTVRVAEETLKGLGIKQVRVRHHNGIARIEVEKEDEMLLVKNSALISEALIRLGFAYVTLDLQWFRSGSMDRALV